jgi:hypothetical protein
VLRSKLVSTQKTPATVAQLSYCCLGGAGKITYTFSANANVLSANFLFSVLPAGGAAMGQAAETESMLALAENVYINLPTPLFGTLMFSVFYKMVRYKIERSLRFGALTTSCLLSESKCWYPNKCLH